MIMIRLALVATTLLLAGWILFASTQANMLTSFSAVAADPWGAVSLIDLYAGLLAIAVIVWFVETNKGLAIALIVLLPVLGNLVALLWLAWRLPLIVSRIAGR